jgi:glucose-1-phosphate cytidylyltransferase
MKIVILAGGLGTRISEETQIKPKPMIQIGDEPLIMHIMRNFAAQGFDDFIICLGYKGYVIKEYFKNLKYHLHNLVFENLNSEPLSNSDPVMNWKVQLIDTGQNTMTGGRLKRIQKYTNNETFILTYGDGLADLQVVDLLEFHKSSGGYATVTAVKPPARFGALEINDDHSVTTFAEKFDNQSGWINGGFFVLEQKIFDYIIDDQTIWEKEPLSKLAFDRELFAFKHEGFWKPCDTLREKNELEELWSNNPPWKNW